MHPAGRSSWQVNVDQPEQLVIGLFVRAAAALPSELAWLPPVFPAVSGDGPEAPEEAGAQWDTWWTQAFARDRAWNGPDRPVFPVASWSPPAFDALAESPALQAVVATHFAAAVAWARARKQEHIDTVRRPGRPLVETMLVADLERLSGHPARPFRLRVDEIPVAELHLWQPHPDHVLVSAALLRDTNEYRRRLLPVVQALI